VSALFSILFLSGYYVFFVLLFCCFVLFFN